MVLHRSTLALLLLVSFSSSRSFASELRNVTNSVFSHEDLHILPAAFGDFNSDKLTDLIVVHAQDRSKVSILLAQPQTFSLASDRYFSGLSDAHDRHLTCSFDGQDVVGVAPADLDGDGGMDLAVSLRDVAAGSSSSSSVEVAVLWGQHDQNGGRHRLVCPTEAIKEGIRQSIHMDAEPLVMDGNGDNIADLYGQFNRTRGLWIFSKHRNVAPHYIMLEDKVEDELRFPHSNAFVDLDADGNADILVTGEKAFHLWQDMGDKQTDHFREHKSVNYPQCRDNSSCSMVGQSVFADFNLDGHLDMAFPACTSLDCGEEGEDEPTIFMGPLKQLWNGEVFDKVKVTAEGWKFHVDTDSSDRSTLYSSKGNVYFGLTPRAGDINLDGYPDLLIRMESKETGKAQMQVLLNVPDSSSKMGRAFLLQPEIMEGIEDSTLAVFYDLYENGMEDILMVRETGEGKQFEIGAFTNKTKDSDAYFAKVIVLSGVCYHDCSGGNISVPYGTNLPGQTICYRTQRPVEETFTEISACATQLPQTAHHSLQLPYTIFGLGMAPNFLDVMYVNVTDSSSHSKGRAWPQIIPNSQVYVIPNPPDQPSRWQAKLFITPSRGITLTGLALVGTCGLCVVIILFFHWRERQEDRREKLQQPNQFHFDAM